MACKLGNAGLDFLGFPIGVFRPRVVEPRTHKYFFNFIEQLLHQTRLMMIVARVLKAVLYLGIGNQAQIPSEPKLAVLDRRILAAWLLARRPRLERRAILDFRLWAAGLGT